MTLLKCSSQVKALERKQELVHERGLHAGLHDCMVSLRMRLKFGSALQLWEQFQTFKDENPNKKRRLEYECKRLEDGAAGMDAKGEVAARCVILPTMP